MKCFLRCTESIESIDVSSFCAPTFNFVFDIFSRVTFWCTLMVLFRLWLLDEIWNGRKEFVTKKYTVSSIRYISRRFLLFEKYRRRFRIGTFSTESLLRIIYIEIQFIFGFEAYNYKISPICWSAHMHTIFQCQSSLLIINAPLYIESA